MTTQHPPMKIQSPCVISMTWDLKDSMNQDIDQLNTPTDYFYGGEDLLPKVEEALLDHSAGQELDLYLEPEHAFGEYLADLVYFEERSIFPDNVEPGMQFEGLPAQATNKAPPDLIFHVTEVYDKHVVVDGNHPLAGISLRLHLHIHAVREATEEELQRQSASKSIFKLVNPSPSNHHVH